MASGGIVTAHVIDTDAVRIGEDRQFKFDCVQSDDSTRQDMTGWALDWSLRRSRDDTDTPLINKTTASGIVIESSAGDATLDRATVTVNDTDTEGIDPVGKLYHVLRRTDAGSERMLAEGDFELKRMGIA